MGKARLGSPAGTLCNPCAPPPTPAPSTEPASGVPLNCAGGTIWQLPCGASSRDRQRCLLHAASELPDFPSFCCPGSGRLCVPTAPSGVGWERVRWHLALGNIMTLPEVSCKSQPVDSGCSRRREPDNSVFSRIAGRWGSLFLIKLATCTAVGEDPLVSKPF